MWGPQQTRRDTCRPLQAWSFVGQLCMCSKWALPARRHWGAHFMVSPLCVCVCVCVRMCVWYSDLHVCLHICTCTYAEHMCRDAYTWECMG